MNRTRTGVVATVAAAFGALAMVASGAFAANSNSGTFSMQPSTALQITCPNALTNASVASKSETINCAPNATTTTTDPVTTIPVTTTQPPMTTTTVPANTSGCTSSGVVAPCISGAGATGWGNPTFDDEFNGSALNTSSWASSWFGGGTMNNVSTSPANISVSGGDLLLKLSSTSVGALVATNPSGGANPGFTFGTGSFVEASIWFPGSGASISNWPAFWTDGQNWPQDGENDIAEGLGGLTSNYHDSAGATNSGTIPGNWAAGWHTYGLDRENGQNTIYWDGRQVFSYKTADGGAPHYLIINVGCSSSCTTSTASEVKVDYTRVWHK